jgi:hypothetical protein
VASLLLAWGCASSPQPTKSPSAAQQGIPRLPDERVEKVRELAPELAAQLRRLEASAVQYAERGQWETAEDLAMLAQLTLVSTLELHARTLRQDQLQRGAAAEEDTATDSEPEEQTRPRDAQQETVSASAETTSASTPSPAPKKDPQPQARPSPEQTEASPEPSSEDGSGAQADSSAASKPVAERLSRLAERLAQLESNSKKDDTGADLALERAQTALIEGDRALAEGLEHRARDLADEASRVLDAFENDERVEAVDGTPERESLVRDARQHLGDALVVRGQMMAVRVDSLVRLRDGSLQVQTAATLNHLRSLVRVYRRIPLLLVSYGDPAESSPDRKQLKTYLADRFQISKKRLHLPENASAHPDMSEGTYLIFKLSDSSS